MKFTGILFVNADMIKWNGKIKEKLQKIFVSMGPCYLCHWPSIIISTLPIIITPFLPPPNHSFHSPSTSHARGRRWIACPAWYPRWPICREGSPSCSTLLPVPPWPLLHVHPDAAPRKHPQRSRYCPVSSHAYSCGGVCMCVGVGVHKSIQIEHHPQL